MLRRSPLLLPFIRDAAFLNDLFCCCGEPNLDEISHGDTIELLRSLLLYAMSTPELGGINPVSNILWLLKPREDIQCLNPKSPR